MRSVAIVSDRLGRVALSCAGVLVAHRLRGAWSPLRAAQETLIEVFALDDLCHLFDAPVLFPFHSNDGYRARDVIDEGLVLVAQLDEVLQWNAIFYISRPLLDTRHR